MMKSLDSLKKISIEELKEEWIGGDGYYECSIEDINSDGLWKVFSNDDCVVVGIEKMESKEVEMDGRIDVIEDLEGDILIWIDDDNGEVYNIVMEKQR